MSYILDALRRADAERERERGSVPGLHTQSLPLMPGDDAPPRPLLRVWLVAGLTALLLATLAWLLLGRESLPADGVAAAPTVPNGAATASVTPVAAVSASPALAEPVPSVAFASAPVVTAAPAPLVVAAAPPTAPAPQATAMPVPPPVKALPTPVPVAAAR